MKLFRWAYFVVRCPSKKFEDQNHFKIRKWESSSIILLSNKIINALNKMETQPLLTPTQFKEDGKDSNGTTTTMTALDGSEEQARGGGEKSLNVILDSSSSLSSSPPPVLVGPRIWVGRTLLLLVAFLYGTLDVALRFVYALPGPPSASALSTARGWLAAVCYLPLLWRVNRQHTNKTNTSKGKNAQKVNKDDPEVPASTNGEGLDETTISETSSSSWSVSAQQPQNLLEKQQQPKPQTHLWWVAMELAVWNFGAQGLLTLGLLSTTSARASFLTQTSVVMTPAISALAGEKVSSKVWVGCLVALVGLVFMSDSDGDDDDNNNTDGSIDKGEGRGGFGTDISVGDVIILSAALCWSLYVFRLSSVGDQYDEIQLQAAKTFVLGLLYSIWFIGAMMTVAYSSQHDGDDLQQPYYDGGGILELITVLWPGWTSLVAWGWIFYSAIGPGTIADVLQQKGQAVIHASEANIVLSMEPVFTALLGQWILGEATSWQEKIGGGLIVGAALIATQ